MAAELKRAKVLLLTTELGGGGAERIVYELATHLPPERYEVRVACLAPATGVYAGKLRERKVPVTGFGATHLTPWRVRRLARLLREWRPDVLHAHLWHANVVARRAARRAPVRALVTTVHVAERRWRPWRFAADRATLQPGEVVVCVSEGARRFTESRGIAADRLRVVRNGIDVDRFGEARPAGPEVFGLDAGARVVLCAGRLDRQKGQDVLLRAWPKVVGEEPWAHLVLAGEGPTERKLRHLARKLRIRSSVRFAGFQRDPERLFALAEIVVAPSRWEGFGLVAAEAGAASKPVVASRVTGLEEIVLEGETGHLVPPGDAWALSDALRSLLSAPTHARAMGEAGRARAYSLFTVERMVADYAALYEEMLERGSLLDNR